MSLYRRMKEKSLVCSGMTLLCGLVGSLFANDMLFGLVVDDWLLVVRAGQRALWGWNHLHWIATLTTHG